MFRLNKKKKEKSQLSFIIILQYQYLLESRFAGVYANYIPQRKRLQHQHETLKSYFAKDFLSKRRYIHTYVCRKLRNSINFICSFEYIIIMGGRTLITSS